MDTTPKANLSMTIPTKYKYYLVGYLYKILYTWEKIIHLYCLFFATTFFFLNYYFYALILTILLIVFLTLQPTLKYLYAKYHKTSTIVYFFTPQTFGFEAGSIKMEKDISLIKTIKPRKNCLQITTTQGKLFLIGPISKVHSLFEQLQKSSYSKFIQN